MDIQHDFNFKEPKKFYQKFSKPSFEFFNSKWLKFMEREPVFISEHFQGFYIGFLIKKVEDTPSYAPFKTEILILDLVNEFTHREDWAVLINNLRDPERGWLQYFGLVSDVMPPEQVNDFYDNKIELIKNGKKIERRDLNTLGFNKTLHKHKLGLFSTQFRELKELVHVWYMFPNGSNTRFFNYFFTPQAEECEDPYKDAIERLNEKIRGNRSLILKGANKNPFEKEYSNMLSFMRDFTKRTNKTLENLVRDYQLGIDLKPRMPLTNPNKKEKHSFKYRAIQIQLYLEGDYITDIFVINPEKRQKKHKLSNKKEVEYQFDNEFPEVLKKKILGEIDYSLNKEEKKQIRMKKAARVRATIQNDLINRVIMSTLERELTADSKFVSEYEQRLSDFKHFLVKENEMSNRDLEFFLKPEHLKKCNFQDFVRYHNFIAYSSKRGTSVSDDFLEKFENLVDKYTAKLTEVQSSFIQVVSGEKDIQNAGKIIKNLVQKFNGVRETLQTYVEQETADLSAGKKTSLYNFDRKLEELKKPYRTIWS